MIFERKKYLDELIAGRGNGLVKIITGVRRCGKSFLLFDIWHNWLLEHGVTDSHIIEIQLDDFRNRRLRKPDALLDYIDSKVLNEAIAIVQPPTDKGKRLKIFYMTQASTKPPTFVVFVNDKELFHFSYERYLINQLRKEFGLVGTPVRIIVREKNEKDL